MRKPQILYRLRYMKYIVLLMLLYPMGVIAAQKTVSVKGQSISMKQAIELIEKNSDYTFFYNAADLKHVYPKNIDCEGTISEVLEKVFEGTGVSYMIRGEEVILKVNAQQSVPQQKKTSVIGVVTDSRTGEPIIGATVQIKGGQLGVITDIDGKFDISALPKDELQISYIGYVTKVIKIANQKVITVTLLEDAKQLDEVVVTAFGTGQKKESITGSIQSVRPTDLVVPSANLSTSFAGRLAGVISYQRSGEPGSNGSDFFIRGIATFNGGSPLIILDGVEISKGDLNALDPEVIESFSVLKDATASAMYGTRGANGVMIIKTKSGSDLEKPIIGVRIEANVTTPVKIPKFASAVDYMKMYNEAVTNQGTGDILYTQEQMDGTANGWNPYIYPNVDWYNEIFKNTAFNQRANFNIRGGTQKITYFMNINVNHETGMLKNRSADFYSFKNNIDIRRYAFQNNIDFHLSKTATVSLRLNAQLNDNHGPKKSVNDTFGAIMSTNPVNFPAYFPSVDEESWYRWGTVLGGNQAAVVNPLAEATNGYYDSFESTVVANLDYAQKLDFITKGLSFKAMFSFKNWSKSSNNRSIGYNKYYLSGYSRNEDGSFDYTVEPVGNPERRTLATETSTTGDRRMYFQTYLNYERMFGDHSVSGMLLFNEDEYNTNNAGADASLDRLINSLPKRRMGIAMRATYDYARRYMFEVNAGYNGSENFAKGHRWGFFPSVSLGWNLSEEKFWTPLKEVVSNFKLRGSYGLVGNDQVNNARYLYLAMVDLKGGPGYETGYGTEYESLSGPIYKRFKNDNISWETGRKLNVGVELQLFHSLNLTVDAFREIRSNIFQVKKSIPNYLGAEGTNIYGNLAKIRNWGVDLAVDYGKQFNRNLGIQFKGTFTFARNKILEYDEAPGLRPAQSWIGKKLNQNWGYIADGLFIDQGDIANSPTSTIGNIAIAPGDIKYLDQPDANGKYDGQITSNDQVPIGHPTVPEIVYGFGPSVNYKKWDFSFFFQGQANASLMMNGFTPFGAQLNRNVLSWIADDYWSAENQNVNANYPRLTKYENNHNNAASTHWLRSAAFLKLKNVELGYSYKIARIYINGSNLLTFSPFKLWDPEMGGGKGLSYPLQRTFNIGIQLNFK